MLDIKICYIMLKGLNQAKIIKKISDFILSIDVFLILDMHVRKKKSGISSLYLA